MADSNVADAMASLDLKPHALQHGITHASGKDVQAAAEVENTDDGHKVMDDDEAVINDGEPESETVIQFRSELAEAQAAVDDLSEDHEDLPQKLVLLAGTMHDYHASIETEDAEPFLRALKTASKGRDLSKEDAFDRCAAMYIQMLVCQSLHKRTKDVGYLHMGEAFGRESVTFMENNGYSQMGSAYSGRCEKLSQIMKSLYDEEKLTNHINNALVWQGKCVDSTKPDDYNDDGQTVLYTRYKLWTVLWTRLMDHRPELQFDGLIEQVSTNLPACTLDHDAIAAAHNYWQLRLGMRCRQWARSKDQGQLETIKREVSELLAWEVDPPCTCHGNGDDPQFSTNTDDPDHVLRRTAGFFDEWFGVDDMESEWYNHLPAIETSLALWREAHRNIPRLTYSDLLKDHFPVIRLGDRLSRKYEITKNHRDGWAADSKIWEDAVLATLKQSMMAQNPNLADSIADLLRDGRNCAYGQSCVTKQNYSVWGVLSTEKPWDLDTQRLKFLDGEFSAECWIRERSEDGKFVLGGALEGRDDDVLDFIKAKDEPIGSRSQA